MTDKAKKYLSDIQRAIDLIEEFMLGIKSFSDYQADSKTKSAIERQLGIIGEAVNTQGDYNRTPLANASRDGNGWNDTWHIENIEFYKNCIVEIYNR